MPVPKQEIQHPPHLPPLPLEKTKMLRELQYRARLSSTALPSVAFYSFLNSFKSLNSVSLSSEGEWVSGCYMDSSVRLWNVKDINITGPQSSIRPGLTRATSLSIPSSNQLFTSEGRGYSRLIGHSGPVFRSSFSPEGSLLLTASEDSTIRLWSTVSRSPLSIYKGHQYPVWDVEFSPLSLYFVSGCHDRTARLWTLDKPYPLRIFCGHLSDVQTVRFHPNGNYIASASSDGTVRMWDIQTGDCVRLFNGHGVDKYIGSLCFSPDGRYLASGAEDGKILIWDIGQGKMFTEYSTASMPSVDQSIVDASSPFFDLPPLEPPTGPSSPPVSAPVGIGPSGISSITPAPVSEKGGAHSKGVTSLAWSHDGEILSSGSLDGSIKLWLPSKTGDALIRSYYTKSSNVIYLKYTFKNLLLGAGLFSDSFNT